MLKAQRLGHQMMARQPRGMTLLGMVFLLIFIGGYALIGMKLIPIAHDYFAVKKIIRQMAAQYDSNTPISEIRSSFDKRISVDYIDGIDAKSLKVQRGAAGKIEILVPFYRKATLFEPVSILVDTDISSNL